MSKSKLAHIFEEKQRTEDVKLESNISFESLFLPTPILNGLIENDFRKPSPIQFKAIPLGRCGFDLIVKSKSGTGKTLVFSIIALENVNTSRQDLQVLILVPTREIAVQIEDVLKSIGKFIDGLRIESFIGGLPLEDDIRKAKGCHIAVGAPGRVKHLIQQNHLCMNFVNLFVLDEADKLMDNSFQSDINEIYYHLPPRKQIIASSATYFEQLDKFLTNYMLSPTHVNAEIETPILLGLKQFVSIIESSSNVIQMMRAKNDALIEILTKIRFTQCLVFTNYQTRAESICNILKQKGWNSTFISAAQSQLKRLEAVNDLKEFRSRILLSTDLTSRGIDAANVDLVINYDIPNDAVTYLHRMGRAGRYGSSGICINLASPDNELKLLQTILGTIGSTNLSIAKLPNLNDSLDLWNSDSSSFEQIFGILKETNTNDSNSNDLKKEIMEFKKSKINQTSHVKEKKKKNKNETVTLQSLDDINNDFINNVINKSKNLVFDNAKTEDFKSDTTDEINQNNEETKKRKRRDKSKDSTDLSQELHKEKQKIEDHIFCKNKALLNVAKLLCQSNIKIDEEIVDSIRNYIVLLKSTSDDDNIEEQQQIIQSNNEKSLNNIFQIAYDYAVDLEEKHWLDHLPLEEIETFQQLCLKDFKSSESEDNELINDDNDNDEEINDEDYDMEGNYSEQQQQQQVQSTITSDVNSHLPVVQQSDEIDANLHEQFTMCYEECNKTLWHNGLTFETVQDFDSYFYQWQEQLLSVRSYVQQNIYVYEMNKFQQSKLNK